MDITELRNQTTTARVAKEAREEAEFLASPLKEFLDRRIKEAAAEGKSEVSLNFYYIKERELGDKYSGPTIDAVIRHYRNGDFLAYSKNWLSPNGSGNTALIISWK